MATSQLLLLLAVLVSAVQSEKLEITYPQPNSAQALWRFTPAPDGFSLLFDGFSKCVSRLTISGTTYNLLKLDVQLVTEIDRARNGIQISALYGNDTLDFKKLITKYRIHEGETPPAGERLNPFTTEDLNDIANVEQGYISYNPRVLLKHMSNMDWTREEEPLVQNLRWEKWESPEVHIVDEDIYNWIIERAEDPQQLNKVVQKTQ